MACEITQADLGPLFAAVDPDVAAAMIEAAELIVNQNEWLCCGKDPCVGIKNAAKHLLASNDLGADVGTALVSERVGDVAATYANATSSSDAWSSTPYGVVFALALGQVEICEQARDSMPLGALGCL